MYRHVTVVASLALLLGSFAFGAAPEIVSVEKIWDAGGHNAFTDLIRFQNQWFCSFREADGHVKGDGLIRIISSEDGASWRSRALLAEAGIDLRDPKLSVTADSRLMVVAGGSVYRNDELVGRQPRVAFSADGDTWTLPQRVVDEGDWLWRVTWHQGRAYGVCYRSAKSEADWTLRLVAADDGVHFETVAALEVQGKPNETTLRFLSDDTLLALVRREGEQQNAVIGESKPPYTQWRWADSGHRVGGPNFVEGPDGSLWAAGRSYPGGAKTVLASMTPNTYDPVLTLPSGGDCSYPGLVFHEGLLWMSYYSSHEGKTSIYLAKIRVPKSASLAGAEPSSAFLRDWLVCGPFPAGKPLSTAPELFHLNRFGTDFLGGETEARPKAGDQVAFEGETRTWTAYASPGDEVYLDGVVSPLENVVAYAYREILLEHATACVLSLGSNDGVRAWLNGEQVLDVPRARGLRPDTDLVGLVLNAGVNRLLLKVEDRGNLWGFACRVLPVESPVAAEHLLLFDVITGAGGIPTLRFRHDPKLIGSFIEGAHLRAYRPTTPQATVWEGSWDQNPAMALPVDATQFGEYTLAVEATLAGGVTHASSLPFSSGERVEYELFADGRSGHSIVVGAEASDSEKWAATELQHWLQEVSGAAFSLIDDTQPLPGKALIVGYNKHAAALPGDSAERPADSDERFRYRNAGHHIVLWGGRDRGTMYAVMSFLERELGCRWYTPRVSVIPRKARFAFTSLDYSDAPRMRVRNDFYYEAFEPLWAARNKVNGAMGLREQPGGVEGYWSVHTFYPLMPPTEFYDAHPEYFSLINGERIWDSAQLCLTNPDVLNIMTERLSKVMREQPGYLIYSLSQNDWRNPCQCANCQALATAEESESGPVLWFVNQVAQRVEGEFPDKFVGTLAYQYTRKPPKNLRPRENVVIRFCSIECCFSHDFLTCPENQSFLEDLRGWSAIAPHLYIWDYVVNFSHYLMPYPNFGVLKSNINTFRENNAIGIMEQAAYQSRGGEFAELRAWVIGRLLWNWDQDVDALVDDFMYGYYGRAGQYVRAYFDLLHRRVTPDRHIHLGLQPSDQIFSDAFVREAEAIFDEADIVADTEEIRQRVEVARLPILYLKCKRLPSQAKHDGTYARFKAIVEREGITHFAESGAPNREAFTAEMDAVE